MSIVAMDCEMVQSKNGNMLARVSIVDQHYNVLLDTLVQPTAPITNYLTKISGIKEGDLDKGISFTEAQRRVSKLLRGNLLVGHSLQNDLKALKLSHPEETTFDLVKYGPFMKDGQPQSLKTLADIKLGKCIQDPDDPHNSVVDAKTAMELYKIH